jgi:thymidylate synthase
MDGLAADNVWNDAILDIQSGIESAPRGMKTREKINHTTMCDMRYPIVTNTRRLLGYKFMIQEAIWILRGDNRLSTIEPYSKMINKFSDDKYFFRGAYGPKIIDQLQYVCRSLKEDRNTRQAVINIWRESPYDTNDIPCTVSFQFLIRQDKLHIIANMRSNDLWLGWPYDNFNFSMLGAYIALLLKDIYNIEVGLGITTINAGSRHLYESNFESADMCTRSNYEDYVNYKPLNLKDYSSAEDFLEHLEFVSLDKGEIEEMKVKALDREYGKGFAHEFFSKAE